MCVLVLALHALAHTLLTHIFAQMSVLVEAQDDVIQEIEHNAVKTEVDTEKGLIHVKQAVVHARNYRKYRWWCFGLIVVILVRPSSSPPSTTSTSLLNSPSGC